MARGKASGEKLYHVIGGLTIRGYGFTIESARSGSMAYTIKYHGHEVACDTPEDVRALLDIKAEKEPKLEAGKKNTANGHHGPQGDGEPKTVISELVTKLRPEQRSLLRIVATNGTVSREDLIRQAGVSDAREFAGLLIGISKSAAGSGIDSPIKKLTERASGRGPRFYKYKIRDDVKGEIKAALAQ
jgi:hypothetical protein